MLRRRTGRGSGASFGKGNRPLLYIVCILLIAGAGLLIYGWWDTNHFDVRRVTIELDGLPPAFDEFTILQVSDLHNRAYGKDKRDLIREIERLSFDIVAITGDLFDRHRPDRRENGCAFAEAAAKIGPAYFIQGNHERRIGDWAGISAELTKRGVRVLDNERITLMKGGQRLDIAGVLEKATEEDIRPLVTGDACCILLAHRPEKIEAYAATGVDLVLSGHAHGGQVRLFGVGLYSPDQGVLPRYTSGVYTRGHTKLYVSRGAGNHSFLPPRIFDRPEIDLITLKTPSR